MYFQKIISISIFALLLFITACNNQKEEEIFELNLSEDWKLISLSENNIKPESINLTNLKSLKFYSTQVPSTVLAALVENKVYENPYFGKNLENISARQFESAWIYIKSIDLSEEQANKNISLNFEGINYSANIWVNGKQVATSTDVVGAFRQFEFNITDFTKAGNNIFVVEVFPPKPGDFTIGFVDWNPEPPDKNMGIFRPVKLKLSGKVALKNPFVKSKIDLTNFKQADLTLNAELVNHSNENVSAMLEGKIGEVSFKKEFNLSGNESKLITISAEELEELRIKNPKLWWPNGYGEPNLYTMELKVYLNDELSDKKDFKFGIRDIKDYYNNEGHRGYKINGKEILIKGAGWVDDLLLADSPQSLEAQVKYAKHLNMNTLRLEGFWGNDQSLYDLCDKYGIMLMVGWSCHWEWEDFVGKECDDFGGIKTEDEMKMISQSWKDQIIWLRNHPSIFAWVGGSDKLPRPELEKKYLKILQEVDGERVYLGAAGDLESEVTGRTGVKMNGPYAFTPPIYWYIDKTYGGAYGFNTETGPGAQVPPLESIKKMMPHDKLWPVNDYWEYHCARSYKFNNLQRFEKAITERYGLIDNVEDFTQLSQVMNYELMRPMFEAFRVNKGLTTGIIQWMHNSSWPAMYWQLYDSYLMPNGAFYGAKKALEPLQLIFDYSDKNIYAVNSELKSFKNLKAEITILEIDSKVKLEKSIQFDLSANESKQIIDGKDLEGFISETKPVQFVNLVLKDSNGERITNNFYWLSSKEDVLDFPKTEVFYTPTKQYADFSKLRSIKQAKIKANHKFSFNNDESKIEVELTNSSDVIALFIELKVVGQKSQESILPIFWEDNYISLLPGEKRIINGTFSISKLKNDKPIFELSGLNISQ